jgi:alpha-glucosidase
MTTQYWWQRAVVYQIYPRSFMDGNGDGTGDLHGIIQRLDYLRDLGIGAIWLSPFYRSPMADFGYDVADYTDVDPLFGDLATFRTFVEQAHARDLKVIVDYVPNHSSDQHAWFTESRSSRDNPKRDWYVWRDAKADGTPPNNWLSVFGGPAWTWDATTEQYYLHSFLKEQPDLNWRNPELKATMLDVLRFWLAQGVDGFRVDVAHFIMKDPDLRDNPLNPQVGTYHKSMGDYDTLIHVHDLGHADVHGVFREMRQLLGEEHPAIGEIHIFDLQKWATYYGPHNDEMHMPFNFTMLGAPWDAAGVRKLVDELEAAIPAGAQPNYVLGNHDEHRVATRVGRQRARTFMLLLLTLRGTPTMYYGDELGMENVPIPSDKEQDPWGLRVPGLGLGRDPERTPMQWDATPNAGFCPPSATPWLPVSDDYQTLNVAAQTSDASSMLNFTRKVLALRNQNAALHSGSYRPLDAVPSGVYAFVREHEGERFLIAINFSATPQEVSLAAVSSSPAGGTILLSTHHSTPPSGAHTSHILQADEGVLVRL